MSLFDGVLGGVIGAGATALVKGVIEQHGGLQGLVNQFQQTGLGSIVQSWVGTGKNLSIDPSQIQQALGSETVHNIAAKLGISTDEVAKKLAEILPESVDKMTPQGVIPAAA